MSVKTFGLAASKKRSENDKKRILQRQSEVQKHFVFPKPETLLLTDKSEFPSLSESLERASNYSPSPRVVSLKYSDKLKSPSLSRNQEFVSSNIYLKYDTDVSNGHQHSKITRSHSGNSSNKNNLIINSNQNISTEISDHSLNKSVPLNTVEEKELIKQKLQLKFKANIPVGSLTWRSNDSNTPVKSSSQFDKSVARESKTKDKNYAAQSQKPLLKFKVNIPVDSPTCSSDDCNAPVKSCSQSKKSVAVENETKGKNCVAQSLTTAKKKKRKSKVKRQVALQSGKITFLTPEVHSKILNQANTLNAQYSIKGSVIGNINDEEEYPELGKAAVPFSQKENFQKQTVTSESQEDAPHKSTDTVVEPNTNSENIIKELPAAIVSEKVVVEKKEKNEKIHSHHPITISFYDMLLEKNIKQKKEVKEIEIEEEKPKVIGLSKLKNKKNSSHPHNLLDSSSPAVKRGKEREKPKPKKPSQLKKIILLDRKIRRENMLQMKTNCKEENVTNENELMPNTDEATNDPVTATNEDQSEINVMNNLSEFSEEDVDSVSPTTQSCVQELMLLNISNENNCHNITNVLLSDSENVIENTAEKSISKSSLNEKSRVGESSCVVSELNNNSDVEIRTHLNIPPSPESLLNSLTLDVKSDLSDKEKAVKILLHTKHFREYCNHLISKDIDDAVFALLDDLARFQDRLHQKDPVKARMKKRMIYGVKEVKKHIKLRKLKCIIIAVDIENVETQGGLNDILNEIKVSAVDHHILYVFALSRKLLGKVCRKPVPVSCVGVFNYEGSEANFKKMVELQSQSKADYTEIFDKLLAKITDEEAQTLIKAKKEAPETLCDVRANILNNFFVSPDSAKYEDENTDLKSDEQDISSFFNNST